MKMKWIVKFLAIVSALIMFACSGGGGGGAGANNGAIPTPTPTLSGVAAAGSPIVNGWVRVMGANGVQTNPVLTDGYGRYSVDVSALTAPYVLYAEGVANGVSVKVFSVGLTAGTGNI